jgi:hypothetical protein
MADLAPDLANDPLEIEGLKDFLTAHEPGVSSGFSQDSPEQASGSKVEVPVEKAAELLGLSINAIHKRLRKKTLPGRKVPGKFKDQWLVLLDETQLPIHIEIEEIEHEPGVSPGFSQDSPGQASGFSHKVSELPEIQPKGQYEFIRELQIKLETLTYRNGYLESQLAERDKDISERDQQIKLLTDSRHKAKWWQRIGRWLTGT